MNTSQTTPFLSEILNGQTIPLGKLAYFRQRLLNRFYDLILGEFLKQEQRGLTKAEVARRIGRRPEQVTRWLGAPGNWTLETVSDLSLAISKAEPEVELITLENLPPRNFERPDWLDASNQEEKIAQKFKSFIATVSANTDFESSMLMTIRWIGEQLLEATKLNDSVMMRATVQAISNQLIASAPALVAAAVANTPAAKLVQTPSGATPPA
jgi:hypothetical protein